MLTERPLYHRRLKLYCVAPIWVPITAPETMISTRRFFCRPLTVVFSATGSASPKPVAEMASPVNPWATR